MIKPLDRFFKKLKINRPSISPFSSKIIDIS